MITPAEKAWLGFTPMEPAAVASMRQLWRANDLPEPPDFSRWSAEFAREVWELVVAMTKPEVVADYQSWGHSHTDELLKLLNHMGVWSDDEKEYQWVPRGWTPG